MFGLNIAGVYTAIGNYGHMRQRETCARRFGKGTISMRQSFRFGNRAGSELQILGLRACVWLPAMAYTRRSIK